MSGESNVNPKFGSNPPTSPNVVHWVTFVHRICSWFLRNPKFETPKVTITVPASLTLNPVGVVFFKWGPILTWHVFASVARDLEWWPWSWHYSSLGCNETNRTVPGQVQRPWRFGREKKTKHPLKSSKPGWKKFQGWLICSVAFLYYT